MIGHVRTAHFLRSDVRDGMKWFIHKLVDRNADPVDIKEQKIITIATLV